MKNQILILLLLVIFSACNSPKKSDEVASYKYEEEKVEMNAELKAKIPEWIEEGTICYGLVVQINAEKQPVMGKPIKAKVVEIGKTYVKMKALESVSLLESAGCTKMGMQKGETWDENEGDFFLTKQEAIAALKEKNLFKFSDKVMVN